MGGLQQLGFKAAHLILLVSLCGRVALLCVGFILSALVVKPTSQVCVVFVLALFASVPELPGCGQTWRLPVRWPVGDASMCS